MSEDPGNSEQITMFLHCEFCIHESQEKRIAPVDYSRLSVGWTPFGIQVWCDRHECNVVHINFEGHTHPANTERKMDS